MKKTKAFKRTFFDSELIEKSINLFIDKSGLKDIAKTRYILSVRLEGEDWSHDSLEEFLADYRKNPKGIYLNISNSEFSLSVSYDKYFMLTEISIEAPTRKDIESLFNIYEHNAGKFYIELSEEEKGKLEQEKQEEIEESEPIIFIGHGKSEQWRDLKDHLHEKYNFKVETYETGTRAGHAIRDILESMPDNSSLAILILTGEDRTGDGALHAGQNVIHEAGLFQGRLGFNRAIILIEEETEDFSNIHGMQQIRYSKNNIKETFSEVISTINREFELL